MYMVWHTFNIPVNNSQCLSWILSSSITCLILLLLTQWLPCEKMQWLTTHNDRHIQRWGTGIRWLMRGMATLPQGNQETIVLEDLRWDWGEQDHGMWYFPFSALTLLVGWQEGHPACKNWMFNLLVMIWLEFCTSHSSSLDPWIVKPINCGWL